MAAGTDACVECLFYDGKIVLERLRARHAELFENMVVRAADKDAGFLDAEVMDQLEVLLFGADPRCDFRKAEAERHTFFDRLAVLFRIDEKFALPDDAVFSAESGEHFVKRHDLFGRIRCAGLLPVAEGRIRDPDMLRRVERHTAVVKGDFRDFVVGINVSVKVRLVYILKRIFILRLLQQVAGRVFDNHWRVLLLYSRIQSVTIISESGRFVKRFLKFSFFCIKLHVCLRAIWGAPARGRFAFFRFFGEDAAPRKWTEQGSGFVRRG